MSMLTELAISFGLGITANLNPCVLPLYPGFLAYITSKVQNENFAKYAGFLVLSGILSFMVIIGLITAQLGVSINAFVSVASPIAFVILIILGILLLLNVHLPLRQIKSPFIQNPYLSAFMFGLFYGPIVIPCNAPLVFAVFAYSVGVVGFLGKFLLFLAFGLGLGVPLIILSFFTGQKGSWLLDKFLKHRIVVNRIAGALLVLLGAYELIFVFRVFG